MFQFEWLWAFFLLPLPLLARYLLPRAQARTAVLRVPLPTPFHTTAASPISVRMRLLLAALAWAAPTTAAAACETWLEYNADRYALPSSTGARTDAPRRDQARRDRANGGGSVDAGADRGGSKERHVPV